MPYLCLASRNIDQIPNDQMLYLSEALIHIDHILNDQVQWAPAQRKLH